MKKLSKSSVSLVLTLLLLFCFFSCKNNTNVNNNLIIGNDSATLDQSQDSSKESNDTDHTQKEDTSYVTSGESSTEGTDTTGKIVFPEIEIPGEDEQSKKIESIISSMSLEEKVGQLFLVSAKTLQPGIEESEIQKFHFGGLVFFSQDFENRNPSEVKALIDSYQSVSKIPLFTSVDEEGGTVTRISRFTQYRSSKFLSPRTLMSQGGVSAIKADTAEKCSLLSSMGLNMNLAPVADVSVNSNDFIYYRSAGDVTASSNFVSACISSMKGTSVTGMLKHFPGYGNNVDTHAGIAIDNRPYSNFLNTDFVPFTAGINSGAGSIMVSHNIVSCMDPNNSASLSPAVHQILREQLHFNGVICTDDVDMGAITEKYGDEQVGVIAIQAGNDLICCSRYENKISSLINAVKSGTISEERINSSVRRILEYKMNEKIIA